MWWAACLLGGCALLRPDPAPDPAVPSQERIEATVERLAAAPSPPARRQALVDLLVGAGVTPLAGGASPNASRRHAIGTPDSLIGGFVPGRHPVQRDELVTVRAAASDSVAAVVLEAAGVLAARSRTTNTPSRSVMVTFGPGADGVARRDRALWPSTRIHARVRMRADGADIRFPSPDATRPDSVAAIAHRWGPSTASADELVALLLRLTTPEDTLAREAVPGLEVRDEGSRVSRRNRP